MKIRELIASFLAVAQAAAIAVQQRGQVSDRDILDLLLKNPHVLSKNSHKILQERAKVLSKRQSMSMSDLSQFLSTGNLVGMAGIASGIWQSILPTSPAAPKSTVAEAQDQPQSRPWPGGKTKKIRYGPYRIPPTSEKNLDSQFTSVQGMGHTFQFNAKKPCDGECTILSLLSSIEYADGSPAENENGAWFHHAVIMNTGPNAAPNCQGYPLETLFMAGNEKSSVDFGLLNAPIKSGYKINAQDKLILTTNLMNMEDKEKWVWVTVTYDYLDGPQPDYRKGGMVWKSISITTAGVCPSTTMSKNPFGASNVTADMLPKSEVFSEASVPWVSPTDGTILMTGGHMHDGGVSTEIFQNDKLICMSIPHYSNSTGGMGGHGHGGAMPKMDGQGGSGHSNTEIEHIQSQSRCDFPQGLPLKKGDTMYIRTNYDFHKFPGMRNTKGELDEVMGIVATVVAY